MVNNPYEMAYNNLADLDFFDYIEAFDVSRLENLK